MTRKRYCKLHTAYIHRELVERNLNPMGEALRRYRGGGQRCKGSPFYFKDTPNYQSDWDSFCYLLGNRGIGVKAKDADNNPMRDSIAVREGWQ